MGVEVGVAVEAEAEEVDVAVEADAEEVAVAVEVEAEAERIGKEEMECQKIADDAEADLGRALPALEKAMIEVEKLEKSSIFTIPRFGIKVLNG